MLHRILSSSSARASTSGHRSSRRCTPLAGTCSLWCHNEHRCLSSGASSANPNKPAIFYYNDIYKVDLGREHRFPMHKYQHVREAVQREYAGQPLLQLLPSPLASREELATTHCPEYVDRYVGGRLTEAELRRVGFPWSTSGVNRSLSSVGGTVAAMHQVCSGAARVSGHFAGGTHHAFFDRGEGYCVFSDIGVAANIALASYGYIDRILIVDLDVHQGNGNAVLFQNNDRVHTFSMHCSGNYFSAKQVSDYDVEVPPGAGDDEYLGLLALHLPRVFEEVRPSLVFYQAGVDILVRDKLGKLRVSREGVQRRNKAVYQLCRDYGARVVVTMGGGYPQSNDPASDAFQATVQAHADVYRNCLQAYGVLLPGK